MTREVQAVVLVFVGGAILRITATDTYLRYVKESLRPWLLASSIILIGLGLLALLDIVRASRRDSASLSVQGAAEAGHLGDDSRGGDPDGRGLRRDDDPDLSESEDDSSGHDHAHGPSRASWLLLLPVLAIFLVAPPALGSYTASRQVAVVAAPGSDTALPALPPGDPVPVLVSDYALRAVWDSGKTLEGRNVSMTGFVSPGKNGKWYLTRLTLTCCAADALAVKVLPIEPPSSPPADTWVTVTGSWVPGGGTNDPNAIPWFKVASMKVVGQPDNPYE